MQNAEFPIREIREIRGKILAKTSEIDSRRKSNLGKEKALSEKWGQKDEIGPLRPERGAG